MLQTTVSPEGECPILLLVYQLLWHKGRGSSAFLVLPNSRDVLPYCPITSLPHKDRDLSAAKLRPNLQLEIAQPVCCETALQQFQPLEQNHVFDLEKPLLHKSEGICSISFLVLVLSPAMVLEHLWRVVSSPQNPSSKARQKDPFLMAEVRCELHSFTSPIIQNLSHTFRISYWPLESRSESFCHWPMGLSDPQKLLSSSRRTDLSREVIPERA